MPPLLIAHRCGPGLYPEQSMASARHALALGADMVEMDVRHTRDGAPVICHDANTGRVFGVDRLCGEMTLAEFAALRHASDPSCGAHTLEDVLKSEIRPLLLHCKVSGAPLTDVARRVLGFGAQRECVIGVQRPGDADAVKRASPELRVLAFMPGAELLDAFLAGPAEIIRLWEDWVSEARFRAVHEAGKQVWVMAGKPEEGEVGCTGDANLRRWARMGADGILVNDIRRAREALGSE